MITPDYLAKVFARMGFSCGEVSCKRRLTDWRQKGLLPSLKEKGRQHHGKLYYWDNPEITAQAITVHKLFEIHSRADWVILSTWFAGYDVSLHKVREIWVNNLEAEINQIKKDVRPGEELADALSRVDRAILMKKRKSSLALHSGYYISLITSTLLNPEFDFEVFEDEEEFQKIVSLLWPDSSDGPNGYTNLHNTKSLTDFLNKNFSLYVRHELIRSSSDRALEHVHSNWRQAKVIILWIRKIVSNDLSKVSKQELEFLILLGKSFIALNLIFIKLGYGLKFCNTLNSLCESLPRIDGMKLMIQDRNSYSEHNFIELRERIIYAWESTPMCTSEELLIETT